MDLAFSEEQQMLRDRVRGVCGQETPPAVVRAMEDDPIGYPTGFWKKLAGIGLLGVAIVYEEFGRALAPSPHFVSSVLSAGVLVTAGSDAQKAEWLPRIAGGE